MKSSKKKEANASITTVLPYANISQVNLFDTGTCSKSSCQYNWQYPDNFKGVIPTYCGIVSACALTSIDVSHNYLTGNQKL